MIPEMKGQSSSLKTMKADSVEYYIADPAGNITALITSAALKTDYKEIAAYIMKSEPTVEQVGFVSFEGESVKLDMSGGEFCGNATMCAAALYCELKGEETAQIPVTVSPYKKPFSVAVKKSGGGFICECVFAEPVETGSCSFSAGDKNYTFPLVCFEGITHIVADNSLSEQTARQVIKRLSGELEARALGIMLYNGAEKSLTPLVYVSALDTLFLENSCASGSCALAAALPEFADKTDIEEPGGTVSVQRTGDGIFLKTSVKIIKKYIREI